MSSELDITQTKSFVLLSLMSALAGTDTHTHTYIYHLDDSSHKIKLVKVHYPEKNLIKLP